MLPERSVLIDASQTCYCSIAADFFEQELEGSYPPGTDLFFEFGYLPDAVLLPIIMRYIGQVEGVWGHDMALVLHHMALDTKQQITAIYRLLMNCTGHGLSIEDDFQDEFARAWEILDPRRSLRFGKRANPVDICAQQTGWYDEATRRIFKDLDTGQMLQNCLSKPEAQPRALKTRGQRIRRIVLPNLAGDTDVDRNYDRPTKRRSKPRQ